jgi:hypothetical protein
MQSDGKLDSDEYMTILAKFPLGTFNTSNVLNKDFNYFKRSCKKEYKLKSRTANTRLAQLRILW